MSGLSWGDWVKDAVGTVLQRLDAIIVALERIADVAEADLKEERERKK